MRICFISDTHRQHPDLPEADLLVHCGDLTTLGTRNQFEKEADWLERIIPRFKHGMLFVPGNHDLGLDSKFISRELGAYNKDPYHHHAPPWSYADTELIEFMMTKLGITILKDQATQIAGIKFYGSPYTSIFFDWGFMETELQLSARWNKIPQDTQVLITHSPPKYILDHCQNGNVGSDSLARRVKDLPALKVHAFGHIHEPGGESRVMWNKLFINAATVGGYNSGGFFNPINVVDTETWEICEIFDERGL